MLFNSIEFAIFMPVVFLLYWFVFSKNARWQNIFILIASYAFYAWWDWRFLFLLVGVSICSWSASQLLLSKNSIGGGKTLELSQNQQDTTIKAKHTTSRIILSASIAIDLLVLGFFKYYNFFVDSFVNLFNLQASTHTLNLILPLGISFYTFQAISYTVDSYRGTLPRVDNESKSTSLLYCLIYIGFFPKLVAGPIERTSNLIPQIEQKRVFNPDQFSQGLRQILWGLFKKIVVADNCAVYVNEVYGDYLNQSGSTLILAAILYTIQIYGDFSGYSDMTIGVAKLLGFNFRDNFLFPYFSRNMGEFWKRWHISLNTWFVDYVYIPLGGSRNGKAHTVANTMIIFLLSGLWHGADWTFVCWGGYHGLLLVILILLGWNTKYKEVVASTRTLPNAKELCQMLLTFALATFGWILFRASNFTEFAGICDGIFSLTTLSVPWLMTREFYIPLFIFITLMFAVEWFYRKKPALLLGRPTKYRWIRWIVYYALIIVTFYCGPQETIQFIYQQF